MTNVRPRKTNDGQPGPAQTPPVAATDAANENGEFFLTLPVKPRKPRLAWQGMHRKEVAVSVPTQIVEIVRPGRVEEVKGSLPGMNTRTVEARDTTTLPPNRLIWTNDNLVALQTLLDERDADTGDWRYRGKVDLVYIDPPFMVQNDFRADNSIDIDLDEDVHVQKEPSLVEILAYKDTWRQGLDTFLTMLRRRLELLKELLAPTGSIYVHLDWHAVHYVKVMMDEIFGYENFLNEIVWQRSVPKSLMSRRLPNNHDLLLAYSVNDNAWWDDAAAFQAYDTDELDEKTDNKYSLRDLDGRRYQLTSLLNPNPDRPNLTYEFLGVTRVWRWTQERMREAYEAGLVVQPSPGAVPRFKRFLDEQRGKPVGDVWADLNPINSQAIEALGYPTQKPLGLLERIVSISAPSNGLVLDCFMGSGTTCEAAERLGRRWIGIDNGKFALHLARKRLIQLHGQSRSSEKGAKPFNVRAFTVENMGVYQRAETWQDFQTQRSRYRDEMILVFGGEAGTHSPLLHGRKGNSWVHVGPLDGPVSEGQVWNIAREAQHTNTKAVTILSADFDTLSASQKEDVKKKTGVAVTIRIIPAQAIDEVRRRIEIHDKNPDQPIESMAVPAFYAPLSIVIEPQISGRNVKLKLDRCEVDIESFISSQRPLLKQATEKMSPAARKKAQAEHEKWSEREAELQKWLKKATSWQKFVDFWAVDWNYGHRVAPDGKPIFETDWQSFRVRKSKGEVEPLVFVAELKYPEPGRYVVAARVTDVFGNDGIATAAIEIK